MKCVILRMLAKYLLIAGYLWFFAGFVIGEIGRSAPMYDWQLGTELSPYEIRSLMTSAALRVLIPGAFCCFGGMICGILSVPAEHVELESEVV